MRACRRLRSHSLSPPPQCPSCIASGNMRLDVRDAGDGVRSMTYTYYDNHRVSFGRTRLVYHRCLDAAAANEDSMASTHRTAAADDDDACAALGARACNNDETMTYTV